MLLMIDAHAWKISIHSRLEDRQVMYIGNRDSGWMYTGFSSNTYKQNHAVFLLGTHRLNLSMCCDSDSPLLLHLFS